MPNRLVICLDGTWNSTFKEVERDDGTKVLKPTNTLKTARAVLPIDGEGNRQITYYDSGVGALGLYPGLSNRMLYFFDSKLGGSFGAGFEANVEQAVNFLALNYGAETDIFVFGFSRGAAQAQALTHFINWLGGLPAKSDAYYIPVFFRHYLDNKGGGSPFDIKSSTGEVPAERIMPTRVRMLGVWDTVMALGSRLAASVNTSVLNRAFHVQETPAACVDHACQALAIDERRYDFRPEIWRASGVPGQTLKQRWFAGSHGNAGGSYGNDGLANCALHWIMDEAKALGLEVDEAFLKIYRPYPQDELSDSQTLFYKVIDKVRFKLGSGLRALDGYPASANLMLDPSVIQRFCSDPKEYPTMTERYRPKSVLSLANEHRSRWSEFLQDLGLDSETYPFPEDI